MGEWFSTSGTLGHSPAVRNERCKAGLVRVNHALLNSLHVRACVGNHVTTALYHHMDAQALHSGAVSPRAPELFVFMPFAP